jgi:hypothetical protein
VGRGPLKHLILAPYSLSRREAGRSNAGLSRAPRGLVLDQSNTAWYIRHMKIEGVSQKGKNRVREHGDEWTPIQRNERGSLLLEAPDGYLKWMKKDDPDLREVEE